MDTLIDHEPGISDILRAHLAAKPVNVQQQDTKNGWMSFTERSDVKSSF